MSQNQSEPPLENHADRSESHDELTNQQLAAQARAAADQALQLAMLAEESARLARHLNEQVAVRAGHSQEVRWSPRETHEREAPPLPPAISTDDDSSIRIVNSEEPWRAITKRISRRNRRRTGSARTARPSAHQPSESDAAQVIRIQPEVPIADSTHRGAARNWKGVALSTVLHVALLVALGLLTIAISPEPRIDTILASFAEDEAPVEDNVPVEEPIEPEGEQQEEPNLQEPQPDEEVPPLQPVADEPAPQPVPKPEPLPIVAAAPPLAPDAADAPAIDLASIGSRSAAGKAYLLKKYGGTAASESAVSRALDWFAGVQRRDGSWNFNDIGTASHAGTVNNPMGATSYVLLAFLGAGQTHQEGTYKANVGRAVSFLIKHHRSVRAGADFRGPNVEENHNFYVQGAAAMALCEAFTMTGDRRLRIPAQRAIDFIVAAQDPHGGGWRYEPFEAGCTSVTTLQLTALISAQRGGFKVPPKVLERVSHFYDTVQCDGGPTGRYCYRAAEPSYKSASTAQAALGRMYLGVTRNDEDLQAAIALLDDRGPYDNRYYCYYATQALKNWGGAEWDRWNQSMRDELVRTQVADEGPAQGSWTPLQRGATDLAGGRLFTTALSTMTLEVYYRYLPLYESFDGEADAADAKVAEGGKPAEE